MLSEKKMALVNTYKSEQQCPRISFSTDFVVGPLEQYQTANTYERISTTPDFEFSATTGDKCLMVAAADELFFNGRLMPLKATTTTTTTTTLRDELLTVEGDEEGQVLRSTPLLKSPIRWKGFLVPKNAAGNKACNNYASKKGSIDDNR